MILYFPLLRASQVTNCIEWLVKLTTNAETNIISLERIKEYSETHTEVRSYVFLRLCNILTHRQYQDTHLVRQTRISFKTIHAATLESKKLKVPNKVQS